MQPGTTTGINGATTHRSNGGATTKSNNRERRSTHRSNRATGSSAREQRNNREPQLRITEKPKEKRSKGATGSDNREHRSTHRPAGTYGSIYPQTDGVTTNGSTEQPGVTDCQQAEPTTRGNGETAGATRHRNLREQQPKATDHQQEQQNKRGQHRTHPWTHRPTTHRPTKAKTGQEGIRDGATWRRRPRIFVRFFSAPRFFGHLRGPKWRKRSDADQGESAGPSLRNGDRLTPRGLFAGANRNPRALPGNTSPLTLKSAQNRRRAPKRGTAKEETPINITGPRGSETRKRGRGQKRENRRKR